MGFDIRTRMNEEHDYEYTMELDNVQLMSYWSEHKH